MTAAVELRDVFRIHPSPGGGVAALQGLSLAVAQGETVVVLGPSGSGKSTLLRLVAGLDRPSAGRVLLFGHDVAALGRSGLAAWRERDLGYADQRYTRALAAELTALELVGLRLGLAGATRAERRARAAELLDRVGLGGRHAARPAELSGGEQQRVALCAALAHRPRLLLADEPTGELDADTAAGIYALLRELAVEHGATTLIVSHDPGSAAIADRVVHLRDGRLAAEAAAGDAPAEVAVGRGGWLRVPEELLRRAAVGGRARAELRDDGVLLLPGDGVPAAAGTPPSAGAAPAPPPAPVSAPAPAAPAATLRAVSKAYAGRRVLDAVDASFPAGRLVAVTGPSGSGKTTLLHVLAGLVVPDAGEVEIAGTALGALGREARAAVRRDGVGWVGQAPGLVPHLDARENVELGLALRGIAAGAAAAAATEALAAVGLAGREGQRVARLSSGERQRVAIARALAVRPVLLVADEPTARLDQAGALAVGALLAQLAREHGTAVVCATHDPLLVGQADEVLTLAAATPSA